MDPSPLGVADSSIIHVQEPRVRNLVQGVDLTHVLGHIETHGCTLSDGTEPVTRLQYGSLALLYTSLTGGEK